MILKFRAWHKELKIMRSVWRIHWAAENRIHHVRVRLEDDDYDKSIGLKYSDEWHAFPERNEIELMQWTGLQDKNGKDIYDGDILSVKDKNYTRWTNHTDIKIRNLICIVRKKTNFYLEWVPESLRYDDSLDKITLTNYNFLEENEPQAIGNVYENPELLVQNE